MESDSLGTMQVCVVIAALMVLAATCWTACGQATRPLCNDVCHAFELASIVRLNSNRPHPILDQFDIPKDSMF